MTAEKLNKYIKINYHMTVFDLDSSNCNHLVSDRPYLRRASATFSIVKIFFNVIQRLSDSFLVFTNLVVYVCVGSVINIVIISVN